MNKTLQHREETCFGRLRQSQRRKDFFPESSSPAPSPARFTPSGSCLAACLTSILNLFIGLVLEVLLFQMQKFYSRNGCLSMVEVQSETGKNNWLILKFRTSVFKLEDHSRSSQASSFYGGNWGSGKSSYQPEVTQPVHGRSATRTQICFSIYSSQCPALPHSCC